METEISSYKAKMHIRRQTMKFQRKAIYLLYKSTLFIPQSFIKQMQMQKWLPRQSLS